MERVRPRDKRVSSAEMDVCDNKKDVDGGMKSRDCWLGKISVAKY